MGMRMPETCWAVFKGQVINLRICCIWLVDSVESMTMHGLANPKLKKVVICYPWKPYVQRYGHRPWYTADADAAEIDACAQKCLMFTAASMILFRINWRCVNNFFTLILLMWRIKWAPNILSFLYRASFQHMKWKTNWCHYFNFIHMSMDPSIYE